VPKSNSLTQPCKRTRLPPGARVDYFDAHFFLGCASRFRPRTPRKSQGRKSGLLFYRGGQLKRLRSSKRRNPRLGLKDARRPRRWCPRQSSPGETRAVDKVTLISKRVDRPTLMPDTRSRVSLH